MKCADHTWPVVEAGVVLCSAAATRSPAEPSWSDLR